MTISMSIKNVVLSIAAVSALVAAPFGCGIGGTTSCDFRDGSVNGAEPRCQERSGIQASSTFKALCESLQGKAIDGPCPGDIVLGCDISEGEGSVVDWYYAPKTADDVKADCASDHGEIVNP